MVLCSHGLPVFISAAGLSVDYTGDILNIPSTAVNERCLDYIIC